MASSTGNPISAEIERRVALAAAEQAVINIPDLVEAIMARFPRSGMSRRRISDQVMMAAAKAGVAAEIGERKAA